MSTTTQVTVRILDKDYQVACPEEERQALIQSADYLSGVMREIRDSGRIVGLDRIAVMAALNLANELLQIRGGQEGDIEHITSRLRLMQEKVDNVLGREQQFSF
ncbi:MAG: cell division protein ZapA [Gammaproteobacteria bacterium]|jgi:cell division protein ZapA